VRSIHEEGAPPRPGQARHVAVGQKRPPQNILGRPVECVGLAWRNVLNAIAEPPVIFVARPADRAAFSAAFAKSTNQVETSRDPREIARIGDELARLDELQETFYARALEGDVACGALITKIIERRCVILGLYTPQTATLQIIEAEAPRETSIERIRSAIDRIRNVPKTEPLSIRIEG